MNIDAVNGMPPGSDVGPKLAIVCSNRGRNGKTLLARLYTDYLLMTGQDPWVFDSDAPHGRLRRYFPGRSDLIDIVRTESQVAMFDRILAEPSRDYVLDLPARDLNRFFGILDNIGFTEEARRLSVPVVVLYVVEPVVDSVLAARELMGRVRVDCFVPVQNRVFGDINAVARTAALYGELISDGEIVLPALDRGVINCLEDTSITLKMLMRSPPASVSDETRLAIYDMVVALFAQFHDLQLQFDLAGLRRLGVM